METTKALWLIGAVLLVILIFYVLLPKLNLSHKSGIIYKSILFFSMMGYIGYDFYLKEKYWYILFLVLGSIAFSKLLFAKKSND